MSAYSARILARSPRLYLRLGESSGVVAADSSGNGVTCAYQGQSGGAWTGGTLGQTSLLPQDTDKSALFNGSSGYVDITRTAGVTLTSACTMVVWCKPVATGVTTDLFENDFSSISILQDSSDRWRMRPLFVGGGSGDTNGTVPIVSGHTYMIAFTYDGATAKLYVADVTRGDTGLTLDASVANANGLVTQTTNPQVARRQAFGDLFFHGTVDEVSMEATAQTGATLNADLLAAIQAPATASSPLGRVFGGM